MDLNQAVTNMVAHQEKERRESSYVPSLRYRLTQLDRTIVHNRVPYGVAFITYAPGALQNEAARLVNADRQARDVSERLTENCVGMFIVQIPRDTPDDTFRCYTAQEFRKILDDSLLVPSPEELAKLEEIFQYAKENP